MSGPYEAAAQQREPVHCVINRWHCACLETAGSGCSRLSLLLVHAATFCSRFASFIRIFHPCIIICLLPADVHEYGASAMCQALGQASTEQKIVTDFGNSGKKLWKSGSANQDQGVILKETSKET